MYPFMLSVDFSRQFFMVCHQWWIWFRVQLRSFKYFLGRAQWDEQYSELSTLGKIRQLKRNQTYLKSKEIKSSVDIRFHLYWYVCQVIIWFCLDFNQFVYRQKWSWKLNWFCLANFFGTNLAKETALNL